MTDLKQGRAVQDCGPGHLNLLKGEEKRCKENNFILPGTVAFPFGSLLSDDWIFLLSFCIFLFLLAKEQNFHTLRYTQSFT